MPSRVLLVCYSRNGTTMRVARHLAESIGADLECIEEAGSRAGFGGYVRSAWEALGKGLPTIRAMKDPSTYDLVVIGTPVWVGTMSSPVRSYLFKHAGHLRRCAFFSVMGGRGGEDTVREMQLACGAMDAPTCVLTQSEVENGLYEEKCAPFVRSLRDEIHEPPSTAETPSAEPTSLPVVSLHEPSFPRLNRLVRGWHVHRTGHAAR
jgi:hypothetical protein